MALRFGKKKPSEPSEGGNRDAPEFEPQPDKAHKWFAHARAMADSYSYDSALFYFASGIKLDPTPLSAHEGMYEVARKYLSQGGAPAGSKEIRKLEGSHPVDKFATAEFAWMKDLNNANLALKFLSASIRAIDYGAGEAGRLHCARILNVLRNQKKPSKSTLLEAKQLFPELGAWDEAIAAGEDALSLDPNDAELENELKDLAAQRAMDQGRYEEAAGEEGGFRKFVKDIDKQRELEERESLAGGLDIEKRNLERARVEYEKSPAVPDVINRYAQLVKAVGTPESADKAYEIYLKGYNDTGQYRFRALAGDIRIEQAQARAAALREKLERDGTNDELKRAHHEARRAALDLQYDEFTERVREYPTDRRIKHHLGEVEFELQKYEEATKCFQEAKDDPQLRVRAGYMLGRCFAAESWHDMAIEEYKEALQRVEPGDKDAELTIRYDLMVSLMEHARTKRSLELAREALEIASSIARKDITYRDIRARRKHADELIKALGTPAAEQ